MTIGSSMRPRPPLAAALVITAVAGILLAGCSLIAVTGPPDHLEPTQAARCTISPVPPLVDGALALVTAGITTYMTWNNPLDYRALLPMGATVLFTSSMLYGAGEVGACRELAGR
jgi:hypothetical protein